MLDGAIEEALCAIKKGWATVVSTPGQAATSAATFGVSYTHHGLSAFLADIGMIAGIGVSVTLVALNLLRFIIELAIFMQERRNRKKKRREPGKAGDAGGHK